MSNRRNNSSNFIPLLFMAIFITAVVGNPGPIVFGIIAYTLYKMFNKDNERQRRDRRERRDYERGRRPSNRRQYEPRRPTTAQRPRANTTRRPPSPVRPKQNPFKVSGIKKYKDYDYEGAIEDFKKALSVDAKDIAVHFNIACAYSIMEQPHLSLVHLNKAIENGFKDIEKIKTHDALAFVRIQPEYDEFVKNGFKLTGGNVVTEEEKINQSSDLLEQLQKLGELRERGLLTEEEFAVQKKKLLER